VVRTLHGDEGPVEHRGTAHGGGQALDGVLVPAGLPLLAVVQRPDRLDVARDVRRDVLRRGAPPVGGFCQGASMAR
jgi:hypothetical protein